MISSELKISINEFKIYIFIIYLFYPLTTPIGLSLATFLEILAL
jgi:hypothetical protein